MKKLFLFLLVLAAFSVSASAQASRYTSVIAKDTVFNIDNNAPCPVANLDLYFSIAAVKMNSNTTAFCVIDHSYFESTPLPVIPVIPPLITAHAAAYIHSSPTDDFTVNDLYVSGSYAFFCGTINGVKSFYGYINLGDFDMQLGGGITGTSVNVYIYCLQPMGTTTAPATLNKLVAYIYDNKYKVVAIGNEDIDQNLGVSKIVEITGATGTPSCQVADMPYFNVGGVVKKIVLDDIVLTLDNVAVLGHDFGAIGVCNSIPDMRYPWISIGKRASVVADICDFTNNPNYYLSMGWEAINAVIGTELPNERIAITYVSPVNNRICSKFRVIDIPGRTNILSQQLVRDTKEDPVDMKYMYDLMKVELLQPMAHPSDYIQLDPYTSANYTSPTLNPNNHTFKSLSMIRYARGHFISTRNAEVYIQDRTANLPHSTASCPKDDSIYVEKIENLHLKNYECVITQGDNGLYLLPSYTCQIISFNLKTQCFSYE